jgi:hypothetical protein
VQAQVLDQAEGGDDALVLGDLAKHAGLLVVSDDREALALYLYL